MVDVVVRGSKSFVADLALQCSGPVMGNKELGGRGPNRVKVGDSAKRSDKRCRRRWMMPICRGMRWAIAPSTEAQ